MWRVAVLHESCCGEGLADFFDFGFGRELCCQLGWDRYVLDVFKPKTSNVEACATCCRPVSVRPVAICVSVMSMVLSAVVSVG